MTKEFLSRIDILLGFVLGLGSTCLVDYLRKKRKIKEFHRGICAELKQILATMNILTLNPDANINREKLDSWISLSKEFDLRKEVFPLNDDSIFARLNENSLSETDRDQFITFFNDVRNQRRTEGKTQSIRKINIAFIQNNISYISLLKKHEQSHLFNILRYTDLINTEVLRLNFLFEKSYDESVHDDNRERLKTNYQLSCQHISDWSYAAAKEIAHLLRQ